MKLYVVMLKDYKTLFDRCYNLREHTLWKNGKQARYWSTDAFLRKKDAKTEIQRICGPGVYHYQPEDFEILTFETKETKENK